MCTFELKMRQFLFLGPACLHGVAAKLQQWGGRGVLRGQLEEQRVQTQVIALQLPLGTAHKGKGASWVPADQRNWGLKGRIQYDAVKCEQVCMNEKFECTYMYISVM